MKQKINISTRGFTIVELLIVIIIVGILSVIVITNIRGIQQRALITQKLAAVDAWEKALRLYQNQYGVYPLPTNGTLTGTACLGRNFNAEDGFSTGECFLIGGSPIAGYVQSNNLDNEIKKVTSIPSALFPTATFPAGENIDAKQRGILYNASNTNSINNGEVALFYYSLGNGDCGRGSKTQFFYTNGQNTVLCKFVLPKVNP